MTSASELFHSRRLRFSRNSDAIGVGLDIDSPSSVDRSNRRHRHYHNSGPNQTRRDRTCDPLRRAPPHTSPSVFRRNSHSPQEREPTRPEGGLHLFSSGNGNDSHSESHINAQDNPRINGNDRLPGAVLLARERLLQRLRGVTLSSSSRQSNRHSSSNHHNDLSVNDAIGLVDGGDGETEISREWLTTITPLINSSIGPQLAKRPPGLTEGELNSLQVEVFGIQEESNELSSRARAFSDCSICLESFSQGDELIRLPCGHRYHFCCLDPWVRTCGDCPYCRRSIDAKYMTNSENPES